MTKGNVLAVKCRNWIPMFWSAILFSNLFWSAAGEQCREVLPLVCSTEVFSRLCTMKYKKCMKVHSNGCTVPSKCGDRLQFSSLPHSEGSEYRCNWNCVRICCKSSITYGFPTDDLRPIVTIKWNHNCVLPLHCVLHPFIDSCAYLSKSIYSLKT